MTKRRLLPLLAALLIPAAYAHGHEIKVLASRLVLPEVGEKTTVYLSWGHRVPVDDLVDGKAIERYEILSPSGSSQTIKTDDWSLQAASVEVKEAGVTQAVVARKATVRTFVIDKDGSKVLLRGPKSAVKGDKIDSSQRSVQCAKALIVAGPAPTVPIKAAGQAIEIVPLDAPAAWRGGATLRFRVLVEGKPFPAASLAATYVGHPPEDAWPFSAATDPEGVASVRVTQPGTWVLKASAQQPASGEALAQYDSTTYTATLALEIRP